MKKHLPKTEYALWPIVLILVCIPPAILLLTQLITLQSAQALLWGFSHMGALLLGWVLLLGICSLCYGATGRLWATWLITALPCVLLSLVSLYKTQINGEPLCIRDFTLIGQLGEVAGFAIPQLKFSLCTVATVVVTTGVLAGLTWMERGSKTPVKRRLAVGGGGLILIAGMLLTGLGPAWAATVEGQAETQAERVKSCGVLVGLYCAWAGDRSGPSDDPSQEFMEQIDSLQSDTEPEAQPSASADPQPSSVPEEDVTVIFLMSESFFDITQLPGLSFETDPIPNFHTIADSYTSGSFLSSTYCGGTGYVEMEVLTGLCSHLLRESDTLTSLPEEVYSSMPCITDVFQLHGYHMEFIHSYHNKLYNRPMIYDAFGFDSVRFADSFPADAEISGGYLSDMALSKEIVSIYEGRGEDPLMLFAVSMENHQPYTAEKYGQASGTGPASELLTEEELAVVDACTHGLMNADRALGYLTQYFSTVDEPVMLVFWGDHLPNLGLPDGGTIYERLGRCSGTDTTAWAPEELMQMLSTDYVIWTNYETEDADAPCGSTMLGLRVLENLGLELTDYYLWLSRYVADKYMMYRPRLYVDGQGIAYASIPEEREVMMKNYAAAVYDIVYGTGQLFQSYRKE